MSKVLCLTGMHRSGTSLTASWIEKCGLTIDNGLIITSSVGNNKGHFEDQEFVTLHSDAIKFYAPNSLGWKIYKNDYLYFTDEQLLQAKQLIESRQKFTIWGWKDPRTTFFLNQWKVLIPEMKTILVWRPFSEVVFSLVKRSLKAKKKEIVNKNKKNNLDVFQIGLLEAMKLWANHNNLVCDYQQKYPKDTIILSLKSIIENDKKVIELINDKFDISLNYIPISDVYDSQLLSNNLEQKLSLITKFIPQINRLEKKLIHLSDL